jgi:hypothetical protein
MTTNLCIQQDSKCSGLDPCGACASEIVTRVLVPALHQAQVTREQAQAFLQGFTEGHRGLRAERMEALAALSISSEAPPPVTEEQEELYESLNVDDEEEAPTHKPRKAAPKAKATAKTTREKPKAKVSPKRATMNGPTKGGNPVSGGANPVTNSTKKEEIT